MKKNITILMLAMALAGTTACDSGSKPSSEHASEHQMESMPAQGEEKEHAEKDSAPVAPGEEVLIFENASPESQKQIRILLTSYLQLKDALVASNAELAKTAAGELKEAAGKGAPKGMAEDQQTFYTAQLTTIQEDADHILGTNAVSHMRDHFTTLSKSTFRLVKAFEANDAPVYYQHCPMAMDNKGAYWISSNEEVRNPYFGDKMLKCGSVVETMN